METFLKFGTKTALGADAVPPRIWSYALVGKGKRPPEALPLPIQAQGQSRGVQANAPTQRGTPKMPVKLGVNSVSLTHRNGDYALLGKLPISLAFWPS